MIRVKKEPSLFYIGASKNLKQRFRSHKRGIHCHTSNHPYLFGLSKTHDIKDLEFKVLKRCVPDELPYYEQLFISDLQPTLNANRFVTIRCDARIDAKKLQVMAVSDYSRDSGYCNLLWIEKTIMAISDPENIRCDTIPFNV